MVPVWTTRRYAAYAQYQAVVNPLIVEWFTRHLTSGEVLVTEAPADAAVLRLSRDAE